MVDDARGLLDSSETVVIGNNGPGFAELLTATNGAAVIDLVGLSLSDEQRASLGERYLGISW